ncbi:phosphate ABC transporter permease subunit PstC [Oscillospiraceae bacterium MB08-C2-2]|nr:phosphate ABC transporter permease subunit PstC [Oscillospiraceae bacterium MB08-C2-2]
MQQAREKILKIVFLLCACACILALLLICVFLFAGGLPAIGEIGVTNFLLGKEWRPGNNIYGILPMILGSIYITAGAVLLGVPVGLLAAVYLAKFCPKRVHRVLGPMVELLAGIPSVVYGFFGLVVLVPASRKLFGEILGFRGNGSSILTASVLLGIMILPTIITVSESAIRAVPENYYEGGLALGATHERSVFFVTLPAAKSGIWAGVVLGIGRAIGETMAVVMVAGNQARMPAGLLMGIRTLTANVVIEMGYAADLHREALIATGVVLFVFILLINLLLSLLRRRSAQ